MARDDILLDLTAKIQTVHHRHHYIADNQVGNFLFGNFKTFPSVGCLKNLVTPLEYHPQISQNVGVVVNGKQSKSVVGRCGIVGGCVGGAVGGDLVDFLKRKSAGVLAGLNRQNLVNQFRKP